MQRFLCLLLALTLAFHSPARAFAPGAYGSAAQAFARITAGVVSQKAGAQAAATLSGFSAASNVLGALACATTPAVVGCVLAGAAIAGSLWCANAWETSCGPSLAVTLDRVRSWIFDRAGNVTVSTSSSSGSAIALGSQTWCIGGVPPCYSTPEEASAAYTIANTTIGKVYSIQTAVQDLGGGSVRVVAVGKGDRTDNGWTGVDWGPLYAYPMAAPFSCVAGQIVGPSGCISSTLNATNFPNTVSLAAPSPVANLASSLSVADASAPLSDDAIAAYINSVWPTVAQGTGAAPAQLVTPADVSAWRAVNSEPSPQLGALLDPLPTSGGQPALSVPPASPSPSASGATGSGSTTLPDYCLDHPERSGCAPLGPAPAPTALPASSVTFGQISKVSGFGTYEGLSCPPDRVFHTHFLDLTWSYSGFCRWAELLRPVILAVAWVTAIGAFFGLSRRGD